MYSGSRETCRTIEGGVTALLGACWCRRVPGGDDVVAATRLSDWTNCGISINPPTTPAYPSGSCALPVLSLLNCI